MDLLSVQDKKVLFSSLHKREDFLFTKDIFENKEVLKLNPDMSNIRLDLLNVYGSDLQDVAIVGEVSFKEALFSNQEISKIRFLKSLFHGGSLINCTLINVTFENCNLNNVCFSACKVFNCKFINCKFNDVFIERSNFVNCEFEDSEFSCGSFTKSDVSSCRFSDMTFNNVELKEFRFIKNGFNGRNLIEDCYFTKSILMHNGGGMMLNNCDFSEKTRIDISNHYPDKMMVIECSFNDTVLMGVEKDSGDFRLFVNNKIGQTSPCNFSTTQKIVLNSEVKPINPAITDFSKEYLSGDLK